MAPNNTPRSNLEKKTPLTSNSEIELRVKNQYIPEKLMVEPSKWWFPTEISFFFGIYFQVGPIRFRVVFFLHSKKADIH